jgi:hypothetical protein
MSSNGKPFTTVTLEDGTFAVVRTDPRKPGYLEVIAIFHDASRARDYADTENHQASKQQPSIAPITFPKKENAAVQEDAPELSERQRAVLEALRAKMNGSHLVEEKAAVLAEAAGIPLGSLHSVLQSLEKKQLIKTARPGSARAPAVYQVL